MGVNGVGFPPTPGDPGAGRAVREAAGDGGLLPLAGEGVPAAAAAATWSDRFAALALATALFLRFAVPGETLAAFFLGDGLGLVPDL